MRLIARGCLEAALFISLWLPVVSGDAANAPDAITLPGDRIIPESISAVPDGTLYIGSAARGGVLRVRPGASKAESWIAPGAFGSKSIFGVLADLKSQTLWVCSNEQPAPGDLRPVAEAESFLIGYDLRTGFGKIKASLPGAKAFCSDIAVGHDGSVYVANAAAPQILKFNPQTKRLDVWLSDPQFQPGSGIGLDGIAVATDGTVYADTYTAGGFFRIAVDNGKPASTSLMPISRPLIHPGALRPIWGDAFFLVEGVGRLDRVTIEGAEAIVDTIRDGLTGPTGVAHANDTTWVAEGQLPNLHESPSKGQNQSSPFRIDAIHY